MAVLIVTYIIFLLAVSVYVGINIYHIRRFRIPDTKDKSSLALIIYLVTVAAVLLVSLLGAIVAYNF